MALKSTIFKIELQLSDLDRSYYQTHALTLARHPSETDERMMVRLVAFALCAGPNLEFGKGLSADDEPDLWQRDLTGRIAQWIEVGLPDEKRVRRACGRADRVLVVSYGGRVADLWWQQNGAALAKQDKLRVVELPVEATQALAAAVTRGMQVACTVQDGELWWTLADASIPLTPLIRKA